MNFKKNIRKFIGFIFLIFGVPLISSTNINCNGKAFHCVNSTHFMICVDLGNGISSTVDDFIIPCPETTVCSILNRFECEFPQTTTQAPLLKSSDVTNEIELQNNGSTSTSYWEEFDVVTTIPSQGVRERSEKYLHTDSIPTEEVNETYGVLESTIEVTPENISKNPSNSYENVNQGETTTIFERVNWLSSISDNDPSRSTTPGIKNIATDFNIRNRNILTSTEIIKNVFMKSSPIENVTELNNQLDGRKILTTITPVNINDPTVVNYVTDSADLLTSTNILSHLAKSIPEYSTIVADNEVTASTFTETVVIEPLQETTDKNYGDAKQEKDLVGPGLVKYIVPSNPSKSFLENDSNPILEKSNQIVVISTPENIIVTNQSPMSSPSTENTFLKTDSTLKILDITSIPKNKYDKTSKIYISEDTKPWEINLISSTMATFTDPGQTYDALDVEDTLTTQNVASLAETISTTTEHYFDVIYGKQTLDILEMTDNTLRQSTNNIEPANYNITSLLRYTEPLLEVPTMTTTDEKTSTYTESPGVSKPEINKYLSASDRYFDVATNMITTEQSPITEQNENNYNESSSSKSILVSEDVTSTLRTSESNIDSIKYKTNKFPYTKKKDYKDLQKPIYGSIKKSYFLENDSNPLLEKSNKIVVISTPENTTAINQSPMSLPSTENTFLNTDSTLKILDITGIPKNKYDKTSKIYISEGAKPSEINLISTTMSIGESTEYKKTNIDDWEKTVQKHNQHITKFTDPGPRYDTLDVKDTMTTQNVAEIISTTTEHYVDVIHGKQTLHISEMTDNTLWQSTNNIEPANYNIPSLLSYTEPIKEVSNMTTTDEKKSTYTKSPGISKPERNEYLSASDRYFDVAKNLIATEQSPITEQNENNNNESSSSKSILVSEDVTSTLRTSESNIDSIKYKTNKFPYTKRKDYKDFQKSTYGPIKKPYLPIISNSSGVYKVSMRNSSKNLMETESPETLKVTDNMFLSSSAKYTNELDTSNLTTTDFDIWSVENMSPAQNIGKKSENYLSSTSSTFSTYLETASDNGYESITMVNYKNDLNTYATIAPATKDTVTSFDMNIYDFTSISPNSDVSTISTKIDIILPETTNAEKDTNKSTNKIIKGKVKETNIISKSNPVPLTFTTYPFMPLATKAVIPQVTSPKSVKKSSIGTTVSAQKYTEKSNNLADITTKAFLDINDNSMVSHETVYMFTPTGHESSENNYFTDYTTDIPQMLKNENILKNTVTSFNMDIYDFTSINPNSDVSTIPTKMDITVPETTNAEKDTNKFTNKIINIGKVKETKIISKLKPVPLTFTTYPFMPLSTKAVKPQVTTPKSVKRTNIDTKVLAQKYTERSNNLVDITTKAFLDINDNSMVSHETVYMFTPTGHESSENNYFTDYITHMPQMFKNENIPENTLNQELSTFTAPVQHKPKDISRKSNNKSSDDSSLNKSASELHMSPILQNIPQTSNSESIADFTHLNQSPFKSSSNRFVQNFTQTLNTENITEANKFSGGLSSIEIPVKNNFQDISQTLNTENIVRTTNVNKQVSLTEPPMPHYFKDASSNTDIFSLYEAPDNHYLPENIINHLLKKTTEPSFSSSSIITSSDSFKTKDYSETTEPGTNFDIWSIENILPAQNTINFEKRSENYLNSPLSSSTYLETASDNGYKSITMINDENDLNTYTTIAPATKDKMTSFNMDIYDFTAINPNNDVSTIATKMVPNSDDKNNVNEVIKSATDFSNILIPTELSTTQTTSFNIETVLKFANPNYFNDYELSEKKNNQPIELTEQSSKYYTYVPTQKTLFTSDREPVIASNSNNVSVVKNTLVNLTTGTHSKKLDSSEKDVLYNNKSMTNIVSPKISSQRNTDHYYHPYFANQEKDVKHSYTIVNEFVSTPQTFEDNTYFTKNGNWEHNKNVTQQPDAIYNNEFIFGKGIGNETFISTPSEKTVAPLITSDPSENKPEKLFAKTVSENFKNTNFAVKLISGESVTREPASVPKQKNTTEFNSWVKLKDNYKIIENMRPFESDIGNISKKLQSPYVNDINADNLKFADTLGTSQRYRDNSAEAYKRNIFIATTNKQSAIVPNNIPTNIKFDKNVITEYSKKILNTEVNPNLKSSIESQRNKEKIFINGLTERSHSATTFKAFDEKIKMKSDSATANPRDDIQLLPIPTIWSLQKLNQDRPIKKQADEKTTNSQQRGLFERTTVKSEIFSSKVLLYEAVQSKSSLKAQSKSINETFTSSSQKSIAVMSRIKEYDDIKKESNNVLNQKKNNSLFIQNIANANFSRKLSSNTNNKGERTFETTNDKRIYKYTDSKRINENKNKFPITSSSVIDDQTVKEKDGVPSINCKNRTRGRYAVETDCRKFYICIGRTEPIIGCCPNNTVFSEIKKQCTKNLSHCNRERHFKCIMEGRFYDFYRKNVYYICVKNSLNVFMRFRFQCQNGYYLNKTSVKCLPNIDKINKSKTNNESGSGKFGSSVSASSSSSLSSATGNGSSSVSSKSKCQNESNESESQNGNFKCKTEGIFANPSDNRSYYVCSRRKGRLRRRKKTCDNDQNFNDAAKKCEDSDSSEHSS